MGIYGGAWTLTLLCLSLPLIVCDGLLEMNVPFLIIHLMFYVMPPNFLRIRDVRIDKKLALWRKSSLTSNLVKLHNVLLSTESTCELVVREIFKPAFCSCQAHVIVASLRNQQHTSSYLLERVHAKTLKLEKSS
jgi:hypothetical protein